MSLVAAGGGPLCAVMLLNFNTNSGHEPLTYVHVHVRKCALFARLRVQSIELTRKLNCVERFRNIRYRTRTIYIIENRA